MDPESKKLLEDTFRLTEENHKMLKSIRGHQRWASFLRIAYWLVIIGIGVGAFYFIQPYIEQVNNAFQGFGDSLNNIKGLSEKLPF